MNQRHWLVGLALLTATGLVGCAEGAEIVIVTNGSSPFWDATEKGMNDAGRQLNVRVDLMRNNEGSSGAQMRRLEQLRAQSDLKGVAVSVVEEAAEGVADQMRALRAKGVRVIAVDSDGQPDTREGFIGTNNLEAGRALGRAARQLLPEGGKAVAFVGIASAQNARERIQGFQEGAGEAFALLDVMEDAMDVTKARRNVVAAMQNHPDLKVLLGIWSYNAPAIADEVSQAGRRDQYKIVVFDAEPNALVAMRQGQIDAMVVQNPYRMGYECVRVLKAMIQGEDPTAENLLGTNLSLDTGIQIVVPDASSVIEGDNVVPLAEFQQWLDEKGLEGS